MANAPPTDDLSETYVDLIRILFAIVLGFSFTLITQPTSSGGFREWFFEDPAGNFRGLLALFLTYTLVISSFIGYHKSTRLFRIKKPYRFLIDVILLFLYFAALIFSADFGAVFAFYVLIFFLYLLWNLVRVIEYRDEKEEIPGLKKRTWIAGLFFLLFIGFYVVFALLGDLIPEIGAVLATSMVFAFIGYRILGPKPAKASQDQSAASP